MLATVVSLGYYLRFTLALYTRAAGAPAPARSAPGTIFATFTAATASAVVIWLGVAPGPMLDWARDAASTLPL